MVDLRDCGDSDALGSFPALLGELGVTYQRDISRPRQENNGPMWAKSADSGTQGKLASS